MAIEWENLLTVDTTTVGQLFMCHSVSSQQKLQIRGYSMSFEGTQQRPEKLIAYLRRQLMKYVFPESQRPEDIDWALARDKFGDIDPESDGKLGEMLLYVFVEAALGTPLMAYKLKDLGNPNDQVKGADGVFVGEYAGKLAVLIGESKIHKTLKSALHEALLSLQRYHERSAPYTNELLIAKKYPAERLLDSVTLETVDGILAGTIDRVLVHPVFVAYDYAEIARICAEAGCTADAEGAIRACLEQKRGTWASEIESLRTTHAKPFQVYLDFFFLPCEDSLLLRHAFYEMLHGHPYESGAVRAAIKRTKKEMKTGSTARPVRRLRAKEGDQK